MEKRELILDFQYFPTFSNGWRRLEKAGEGQRRLEGRRSQKPKTAKSQKRQNKKKERRGPFDHGPFPLVDHWRSHRNVDCLSEIVMPPDSRL